MTSNLMIFVFCIIGGKILTLIGLSIGWMIGSLLTSVVLFNSNFLTKTVSVISKKNINIWLRVGQLLLGVELGLQLNSSILATFKNNSVPIALAIVLSLLFALISGVLLYKFCKTDLLTSFYSTAPGGLSAMPGMAHEAGANTGIVTVLQTIRIFLVVTLVPFFISMAKQQMGEIEVVQKKYEVNNILSNGNPIWTILLVLIALTGTMLGKKLKFPVPWLIGSMIAVAVTRNVGSLFMGKEIVAFWPGDIMIISQIMIGASIGSMFKKSMFIGMKRVLFFSFFSTIGLLFIMMLCAYIITNITGIPFVTTALAFAPGGVAEMTTVSVILQADPLFVVAVQVLRVLIVNVTLPPLFSYLQKLSLKRISISESEN